MSPRPRVPLLAHLLVGVALRVALAALLPPMLVPSRVEFAPAPYSLLEPPTSFLARLFAGLPASATFALSLVFSTLPAIPLSMIDRTAALVHLYSPFSIVSALALSSASLVVFLQALVLLIPQHPRLLSPLLPLLVFLSPSSFPLLIPLVPHLSPSALLTLPVFAFFTFPTAFFVSDLTPNLGMYWNLFTHMFPEYTALYTVVIPLVPTLMALAMVPRMRRHPFYFLYCLLALIAVVNPYQSVFDHLLLVDLFPLVRRKVGDFFWKMKLLPFLYPLFIVFFATFVDSFRTVRPTRLTRSTAPTPTSATG